MKRLEAPNKNKKYLGTPSALNILLQLIKCIVLFEFYVIKSVFYYRWYLIPLFMVQFIRRRNLIFHGYRATWEYEDCFQVIKMYMWSDQSLTDQALTIPREPYWTTIVSAAYPGRSKVRARVIGANSVSPTTVEHLLLCGSLIARIMSPCTD